MIAADPHRPSLAHRPLRAAFAASTAIAALLVHQQPVLAGPQGGNVVAGSAAISQTGPVTNVDQSSQRAIINWQSFSVGRQETVNFNQPNSSSVTLNRVTGNESSVIAGAINANGQVFLVNSNGILFTGTSQVNVGGLVASTLDISNTDFMAGNSVFSGSSPHSVVNRGALTAASGGYVSLMGKTVSNQGVITATLGTVALTAGSKITLNFEGNSLFDVSIDQGVLDALVENRQLIKADGGHVVLTARAADAVLSAQVNNSGIVQARTMASLTGGGSAKAGKIKIQAYGGTTRVSGTLDASAPNGGDGGVIETSGDTVKIDEAATITTAASLGATGTWLIDPDGFTIAAAGGDITGTALARQLARNNVTILSTDGSGSDGNITVNDKVGWKADTTLTLEATNAIAVNAAITGSGATSGLVLNAGTHIDVNAASALQVATLDATAGGDVNINAPQVWTRAGNWTFSGHNINVNNTVDWSAGTLTLNAGADGGFINLNAVMTASDQASFAATYNTGTDTSTVDVTYMTWWGEEVTDTQPTATYGTPFGGINPLYDPEAGTFVGRIDFVNSTAANPLVINGNSYTLITSMAQLASLSTIEHNPDGTTFDPVTGEDLPHTTATGYYALATNLDASGTVYSDAVVYELTGTLDGLGHTISNLTIAPTPVLDENGYGSIEGTLGLVGTVGTFGTGYGSGTVRNIGLLDVQISGVFANPAGFTDGSGPVGPIAAINYGSIINTFATGNPNAPVPPGSPYDGTSHADGTTYPAVTAAVAGYSDVGGLVGSNYGLIANSHSDVDVFGISYVGGFVGWNQRGGTCCGDTNGVIVNSYATGTVTAGNNAASTGGWMGSSSIGGFVGYNGGGVISNSYASGQVWSLNGGNIGGFAGTNSTGAFGEQGALNNVSASGTINLGWSATQGYGGTAGGLVGENEGAVNGGYTSSNMVVNTVYYPDGGFNLLFENTGAAFGNQEGTANGVTATGLVTYNGDSGPSQRNYTGGWDFGGTTNPTYNPGAGGTPPQQSGSEAAQQAAAQAAADARAQAQALAQQAIAQQQAAAAAAQQARLETAANAAMVSATTGTQQAADNPPSSTQAKAGSGATTALAGPSVIDHIDTRAAPQAATPAPSDDERRRRAASQQARRPAAQQPGYRGTIRAIEVDGKRFNLEREGTPAGTAPGAAPAPPAAPAR